MNLKTLNVISWIIFLLGILYWDINWWWISIIPHSLTFIWISIESEGKSSLLTSRNFQILLMLYAIFLFILSIIYIRFVSSWFWLNLINALLVYLTALLIVPNNKETSKSTDKKVFMSLSIVFLLLYVFIFIEPVQANNIEVPKQSFSSYSNYDKQGEIDAYYGIYYNGGNFDTEHVVPKDWFKDEYIREYNNYVNIIKANEKANNFKNNYKFCNISKTKSDSVLDEDKVVGYRDLSKGCFMPLDRYKGDVARITLYMYILYHDKLENKDLIDVNLMKKWAREDPISKEERTRYKYLKDTYNIENPLINNPNYIRLIVKK